MYGLVLIEMTHVAEQEHLRAARAARLLSTARHERRRVLGPGRAARAWEAFWAPRGVIIVTRTAADRTSTDLVPCADC
jgi:hypothetical protein